MQKRALFHGFLTTYIVCLLLHAPLRAQVLLKPTGGNALPLRTKTLDADVRIQGQFAVTRLTLLFQNETSERIEADFVYTLPKDTLVTYFAYWFGDEKVVARVVEKERAAAIYRYITSRMRDPALIELIGKSTFRARIFPVMPDADLKVEMTLVQALPSTANGAAYTLPLRVQTKTDALEAVNVSVRVRPDTRLKAVENNYGLPVEADNDGYRIRLTGTNFRPQKDLRIGLIRPVRPMQVSAYAAPSSRGGDGFFALAVTPGTAGKRLALRVQGVRTYAIVADRPRFVRAHQALMIVGRYKGSGTATVTLMDGSRTAQVETVPFPAEPEPNNVASKLWAARRIEQLSANRGNEEAVVALSKRYTLPSKFTSWLAIPRAEKERYEREQAEAEISVAARQLAQAIRQGQANSRRAQRIRARLTQLSRKIGEDPRQRLRDVFSGEIETLSSQIARQMVRGRSSGGRGARRSRARLNQLCRQIGLNPREEIARQYRQMVYEEAGQIAGELAQEIISGRENASTAQRLRTRLDHLSRQAQQKPHDLLAQRLDNWVYPLADALFREQRNAHPDAVRIAALRQKMDRLGRSLGKPYIENHIRRVEKDYLYRDLHAASRELTEEYQQGREAENRAEQLRARVIDLNRRLGQNPQYYLREIVRTASGSVSQELAAELLHGQSDSELARRLRERFDALARQGGLDSEAELRANWQWRLQGLASELLMEQRRGNPDEAHVAQVETQFARLARAAGVTPQQYIDHARRNEGKNRFEQTREALIAERRKENPDRLRITELERQFRRLHESWRPRSYVEARLERLAVEVEMDRLEKTQGPPTPEVTQRRAQLTRRFEELRARMGDPLIQVEAPPDALQVVAVLPGGEIKRLMWNAAAGRWEARFDIPTYAQEGTYVITVIIVDRNGTRRTLTLRYHVDVTPPTGVGRAQAAGGASLRLEFDGGTDTARVSALLPWGEQIALKPSGQGRTFFARVPVPLGQTEKATQTVTFIVTDQAHNRSTVTVEVSP